MIINYLTIITSAIMIVTMMATSSLVNQAELKNITKSKSYIMEQQQKYLGIWVTGDGFIRQELLPDGRYDEARGDKKSAYTGRYEISGSHIKYWDDTGFTATGDFSGTDTLYHGGYIFYREHSKKKTPFIGID